LISLRTILDEDRIESIQAHSKQPTKPDVVVNDVDKLLAILPIDC
jgi:hypothetical protein